MSFALNWLSAIGRRLSAKISRKRSPCKANSQQPIPQRSIANFLSKHIIAWSRMLRHTNYWPQLFKSCTSDRWMKQAGKSIDTMANTYPPAESPILRDSFIPNSKPIHWSGPGLVSSLPVSSLVPFPLLLRCCNQCWNV